MLENNAELYENQDMDHRSSPSTIDTSSSNDSSDSNTKIFRHVAYIFSIKEIKNAPFVRQEGWDPSYLEISGHKVSRVNIVGIIITKSSDELTPFIIIDDGTASIMVKFLEPSMLSDLKVGDVVLVIGRTRQFLDENYIVAELTRKVDKTQLYLRRKELYLAYLKSLISNISDSKNKSKEKSDELISTSQSSTAMTLTDALHSDTSQLNKGSITHGERSNDEKQIILSLIEKYDSGNGADIDKVISESNIKNAEDIINHLILIGEIYEIRPGKLKLI